jgi:hypothetical protein
LINLPNGDMNLIGPQPEVTVEVPKEYTEREGELLGPRDNPSVKVDEGGNDSSRLPQLLTGLFSGLDRASVRWCVLRKYEGFPTALLGRDIDILVHPDDLPTAVQAVYRISNISVTRLVPNADGVNLCADGVRLDFISSLAWRGQPYLELDQVLARSANCPGRTQLRVPDGTDKAIIMLFQSYLATGGIKPEYRNEISTVFAAQREQVIARISPRAGMKLAVRLVSCIAARDYDSAVRALQSMGWRLFLRNLARNPGLSLAGVCTHYWERLRTLLAPEKVMTVAFVGVDGTGKSTVLAEVEKALRPVACHLERRYFRPKILYDRKPHPIGEYIHPHSFPQHSALVSVIRAMVWCAEYWIAIFLASRKGTVLQFYDRYFHDVVVDPRRCGYGGPGWFVRMLDALVVEPELWVLLDAPPEVTRARKPEFDVAETSRQRLAYLATIAPRRSVLVIDAGQPLKRVVEQVEAAILQLLEKRAVDAFARAFKMHAHFRHGSAAQQETSGA